MIRLHRIAFPAMLAFASLAGAQQRYGWAVSESSTTPCDSEGQTPVGLVTQLFLWCAYGIPDGLSAANIAVSLDPPNALTILNFSTSNGFLNAGTPMHLLLAVGGCPQGSLVAGHWLAITNTFGWEFCLTGPNYTATCDEFPVAVPNEHRGFANNSPVPACCVGFATVLCKDYCGPTPVESSSWGAIKGMYR